MLGGEVYFVAIIKDLGSDMQKITIQTDVVRKIIRSNEYIYNYDLYHGSPTGALEVYVGVFDDDGWPSDRTEKLKPVQEILGTALEAFPQAAVAIPLVEASWPLPEAYQMMKDAGVRHLLVTRNNVVVGLVSLRDLLVHLHETS